MISHETTLLNVAMRVYGYNGGAAPLSLDYLRVASYPAGSTAYVSSTKDAGASGPWGQLTWSATVPSGTSLTMETRSSTDRVNWSTWTAVSTSGGSIASPAGRYLEYRATLTSSATDSPSIDSVSYTTG